MNCREIQDLLTPYLMGDLEPAQAVDVRAHLQMCAICQASVEELQATLQLLREDLTDTSDVPQQLPEKFILQFKKRRWRRPRIAKPKPAPSRWGIRVTQWAAVAAILFLLAGLMLPNLSSTRERARRVNDLSNLNAVWKATSAWGLSPEDSFRPNFPDSLDAVIEIGGISKEMLVSTETGEPIEYYPGAKDTDGDRPLLVSHGKGGRNVVKVAGSGMWVADGTPEAEALTKQLAGLPKQVASVTKETTYKEGGPPTTFYDYWQQGTFSFFRSRDDAEKSASRGRFEDSEQLLVVSPSAPPPPAMQSAPAPQQYGIVAGVSAHEGALSGGEGTLDTRVTVDYKSGTESKANEAGESSSASKLEYASAVPIIRGDAVMDSDMRARIASADIKRQEAVKKYPGGQKASEKSSEGKPSDRPGQPADALRLKESESAERKEASAKPLEIAAQQPARKPASTSTRLTVDYAAGPPAPKRETKAETKEVKVTTTAAAAKTAVNRITVAAPAVQMAEGKIGTDMSEKIDAANIARLQNVRSFQKSWGVTGEKKAIKAKLTLFKAKYQDGDWDCNPGALSNLTFQIRALSKDRIAVKTDPEVMDIGTDRLFTMKPPFVYLTGSRGINLRNNEVRNMRDYLMLGGAIWVDSASPRKDTLLDISVRREMKRVFPDRDFEVVPSDHEIFNAYFDKIGLPPGWANSKEPVEMINIGKELAVLYTLNDYGKLWTYRLDKEGHIDYTLSPKQAGANALSATVSAAPDGMVTDLSVINAYKFGINVVVHLLTRYQKYFKFLPITPSSGSPATNAVPAPEPAASNAPPVNVPICRATGVNPFVSAEANPFSTFSIDVDTASYTLSRNYLLRGQLPPPESVRTEEFVNFFDYDYPPPSGPTFAVYTDCGPSAFGRGLSLLKIGVKGRRLGREEKRAAVLTLLIDTSGSMATPDRIELVKSALSQMVERLDPADKVAIVQYDSHPRLLLEHTPASDKKRILAVIESLQTSGSTALEEGMREAYAVAARGFNSAACNRVLLLSDGMANLGTTAADEILKSIEGYRKQGITLSVFGFGLGAYNDAMLETLANKGDGVYSFIDSPDEAKRVLVDDLAATVNLIARDVKIQVEFNPKRVKQYRQLGYENRQLKKEEFRDDSVDAGEIGSGQSVTALYELELQGNSHEPLGMVRVRCRNTLTGQIEEIEQPITPAGMTPFEAMDARFRLAAAAVEFSEILRGSPFAAGSRLEDVARILRPIALELSLDKRIQEFLRMTQTGITPKFQEAETP